MGKRSSLHEDFVSVKTVMGIQCSRSQTNYQAISKPSEITTDFEITQKVPKVHDI